jgi:hypothetical protein
MKLAEHPTVKAFYENAPAAPAPDKLDAAWLRRLCQGCWSPSGNAFPRENSSPSVFHQ